MSLDISLIRSGTYDDGERFETIVFDANITHNLTRMAEEAGLYTPLWHPEELGITQADQLISTLRDGIAAMEANPDHFRSHDSPNGWDTYKNFLPWLKRLLEACEKYPTAKVDVSI